MAVEEKVPSTEENEPVTTEAESSPPNTAREAESSRHDDAVETMPSLEQSLRQAELQAQEHYDAWLRAKAETENVRKRAQLDVANTHKYAAEKFAGEMLAVKDSLEAALNVQDATIESYKSGVELTLKQLNQAFERLNIREINPLNEKFDPHQHQAITMVDSDAAPNTVVEVMQKGYGLHERVLRPAMVIVARAKGT